MGDPQTPMLPAGKTPAPPSITVVICVYTERRWSEMLAAVGSALAQSLPPSEVVVVVDHNPALLERLRAELADVAGIVLIENRQAKGLSGARNSGSAVASGEVIAFLDDDAVAEPDWLVNLVAGYGDPTVVGVGGAIEPLWAERRPDFFPEEFDWVVGCSYRGLPATTSAVRNVIGANMSLRREVLEAVGGFRSGIGRVGTLPMGCEETELCIRVKAQRPRSTFLYEPAARVKHHVPADRATWRYFRSRCYAEGLSKARVVSHTDVQAGLSSERSYVLRTLPQGALRAVVAGVRQRDIGAVLSSLAIGAGLAYTTAGYIAGSYKHRFIKMSDAAPAVA